jgi:hypothetical protein
MVNFTNNTAQGNGYISSTVLRKGPKAEIGASKGYEVQMS